MTNSIYILVNYFTGNASILVLNNKTNLVLTRIQYASTLLRRRFCYDLASDVTILLRCRRASAILRPLFHKDHEFH